MKTAPSERLIQVEPLRTAEDIQEMKLAIKRGNKAKPKRAALAERDLFLFTFGINTGLRVSDIVPLTVGDIKGKDAMVLREGKTAKPRKVLLAGLQEEMAQYVEGKTNEEYLFPSQKGDKPMTTTQVYRMLRDAGDWIGRHDIGTHTMRKTFGYHYYRHTKDIMKLADILNHSAPSITKRYIGITQDEITESLEGFKL
ncbi:tyrosine-type recombinase/integrase [Bacillus piscicola]|uniref:tyrosine-type recombinase/integrase n=1 Tax=Bacillus piscicola TaxID=1632684 RepID=UPI001F08EA87|nr:tyrosine-type recombinase/integrase [Bacillus piscicola]